MPVDAKHLILTKIETTQGLDASPGAADAVAVFNPRVRDSYDIQRRQPSGFSLSKDIDPVGRNTREMTFLQDLVGSNVLATPPPWGKHVKACGMIEKNTTELTMSTIVGKFSVGEVVMVAADNTRYGISLETLAPGAGPVPFRVIWMAGLLPTATDALVGASSGATGNVDAPIANHSFGYVPDSTPLVECAVGAWAGGAAPIVGNHLVVEFSGEILGGGTVYSISTPTSIFKMSMHWGAIAAGAVLRTAAGATATISAVVQTNVPSLSILSNLDMMQRRALGARGTFKLSGANANPMQFEFTFTGQVGTHEDAAPPVLTTLGALAPPRLLGAAVGVRTGLNLLKIPVLNVEIDMGGQVGMRGDANQPGGDIGSEIATRLPSIRLTVGKVGYGSVPSLSRLQTGTPIGFACRFGTTAGNIMVIAAPRCQVVSEEDGNDNGIATNIITIEPKRRTFAGDDEFVLAQM